MTSLSNIHFSPKFIVEENVLVKMFTQRKTKFQTRFSLAFWSKVQASIWKTKNFNNSNSQPTKTNWVLPPSFWTKVLVLPWEIKNFNFNFSFFPSKTLHVHFLSKCYIFVFFSLKSCWNICKPICLFPANYLQ